MALIPQPQTSHDSFSSSSSSSSNGSSSEAEKKKIDSSTLKPPTATNPSKTSKYKCPTCNKSFSTDQGLQYHLSPSCHVAFSSKKLSALKSYLAPNDSLVENFKVNVTKTRYEFVSSEGIQFQSMKAVAEHFEVSPNSSNSSTPDTSPAKIISSSPPCPLIFIPPRQILTLLKTLTRTSLNQPWGIKLSTILSTPRDCCGSEGCRIRVRKTLIRISEISGIGLNQGLRKGDMITGFWGGECDDFGVLTSVMRNAMTIEITIKRYETIGERREREEEEERKEKKREERREGVKDRLRRSIFVKKEKEKGSEVIVKSEMEEEEEEEEDLLFDVEIVEEDNFVEANLSLIERHTQEEEDGVVEEEDGDVEEEGLFEENDDGLFGDSDSDEGGEKGKAEKNGGKEKGSSIFMGEVEESEDDMSMSDDDDDDDDDSDDSNDDLDAPQTTSKTTTTTTTTSTSNNNNNNNNADDIDNRTNSDVDPTNPPETIDLLSDSEDEVQIIELLDKPPTEIVEIPDSPSKPPKKPKERIRPKAKKKPSQPLPLPSPPPLPPSTSNKKIHVSNLPSSATQNDLFVYFALAGKVTFVTLPPIPMNHVIRSAVIKFKDGSSAEKAVSEVGNWKEFTSQFDQGLGLQAMYKLKVRFFDEEPPEMTRKKRSRSFNEGTGGRKVKVKEIKRAASDPMGGVPPHGAPLLAPRAERRGLGWELEKKRAESEPKKKGTENEEKEEEKRAKQQRKKEKAARLAELVQATNFRNYVSVEGFPHNFTSTKLPEVFQHCGKVVSFARGISGENRDRTEPRQYYVEFENGAQANTCAAANHAKRSFFKNLMGKLSVIPVKPHKNATVNPNYNMQPFHGFVRFSLNTLPHNKPLTSVKLFSKKNHVVYIKTVAEFFESGEAAVSRVVFTAIGHNLTEGFVQFKLRKKVNPKQTNAQTEHTKIAEATAAAINLNGEKLCGVSVRTYYDTSTKAERHNQTNIINELRMKSQETADL
ncbi:hypothetical protein TL16_g12374 [Triparma laevis f. inornata]|uniref:Uncharacterized protein n=1 Tax=Triparma laevis f. inornata TaxID=1714386 RepID=A0A9W7BLC7_9STRA|nr:hypothetical protein TL16_g12374 [Triparma laevis f. inornata]